MSLALRVAPGRLAVFGACALGLSAAIFDVGMPAGLTFRHENSPTSRKYLIEAMGGGVALLDYNNDGLLDLFLVNSGHLADSGPPPESFDPSSLRYWNRSVPPEPGWKLHRRHRSGRAVAGGRRKLRHGRRRR